VNRSPATFTSTASVPAPHRSRRCTREHGFTLVELMVSLTILGVLTSIAVPSFARLIAANRLSTQASELTTALNMARSEAVRRSLPVTLRSADADNYALGWTVFPDANFDCTAAGATNTTDGLPLRVTDAFRGASTIKRVTRSAAPAPFTYTTSTATDRRCVVFTERGAITAAAPAFFRLCDPKNPAVAGRIVQVNAVGKVSIDSVSATCP
jgi:type IV fimbrial biogenesis protein FimT